MSEHPPTPRLPARTGHAQSDSDLISGMLTAIRDFVQDAFGRGEAGQLEEIDYGDLRILIEAGKYTYIAAVVEGFEPLGYRGQVRDVLYRIEHNHFRHLRRYDGDATALASAQEEMRTLMVEQLRSRDAGAAAREASRLAEQRRTSHTVVASERHAREPVELREQRLASHPVEVPVPREAGQAIELWVEEG